MRAAACLVLACAGLRLRRLAAASPLSVPSFDVSARLYKDSNCFEDAAAVLLRPQSCYANTYTNRSKAFSLKIVSYGRDARVTFNEYTDNCHQKFVPQRTLLAGKCERWTGPFYVFVSLKERSHICTSDCSNLLGVEQRFFSRAGCRGLVDFTYRYPAGGAEHCLRQYNGTQFFEVSLTKPLANITLKRFMGDGSCSSPSPVVDNVWAGRCYELYTEVAPSLRSKSFRWEVDDVRVGLVESPAAPRSAGFLTLLAAAGVAAWAPV